ncbi:40S ribosomal protein S25 [Camellia lanceoleosa]|uniref:40S ribosomal protein S25 n=1 Tax=Camellia lanceoleosa TaxID=1840588 RepID=A0ACC0FJA4_9ERIC|nr:40S ribosomal protein S25 [Camellia lanceoleosa]
MAPKKEKAPPSSKPAKSGGGKQKKKKWSKGKQKEKVNNMVLFDKATYDKLLSEASKYKLVTPSILSDRLRINGSLARKAIKDLMARGSIRMFYLQWLYSNPFLIIDGSLLLHRLFVASVVVIGSIKIVRLQVCDVSTSSTTLVFILIQIMDNIHIFGYAKAKANKKLIGKRKENYSRKGIKNTKVMGRT